MRAQQVNQNLPNTLLITNYICLRGKLTSAPLHFHKRKILEGFFITKLKPELTDQIQHHALSLIQYGVT